MTRRATEPGLIQAANEGLLARMERELKSSDDESSIEQFIGAECIVDQYLTAVGDQSAEFPDRQDLAFSLALLLVTSRTLVASDMDLLGRLNAPEVGVSLIAISSQVEEMKVRAITAVNRLVQSEPTGTGNPDKATPMDNDEPPF
ncbi:hypothetical protein [Pandoraea apista]|uniref:hypothetical protein n=1 Tax=Pandoraea apista TaxID=93218 RepID=UPI00058A8AA2|nr:hypothetical protein [Pandoraea apista]AJE97265.1 hypothetical protein SG18_02130 [Pandoraea apista]AKH71230.1 hypothetical protein XM39_02130 [Pandoraea apista]AKI63502.1 hypothetical protein AA956_19450 [Pandoraea apista]